MFNTGTKYLRETCLLFIHLVFFVENAIEQWIFGVSGNCSRVGVVVQELLSQYLSGRFFCKMSLRKHISTSEENIIYHPKELTSDQILKVSQKRYYVLCCKITQFHLHCIKVGMPAAWYVKSWQLDRGGSRWEVEIIQFKAKYLYAFKYFVTF